MRSAAVLAFALVAFVAVKTTEALEEPKPEEVAEYRRLVQDWSERASRVIRALKNLPSEEAASVSGQLEAALSEARAFGRPKREAAEASTASPSDGIQNFLNNFNEGLKSLMNNVTASPVYQQFQEIGKNLGEKGKEIAGKLEEQVKKLQQSDAKQTR